VTELPSWWDPLAGRAADVSLSDFGELASRTTRLSGELASRTTGLSDVRAALSPPAGGGRRSAVLILLGETEAEGPDVLLLRRAATLRNHAGQPAFPGGGADTQDVDAAATALREANEEVGLEATTVTVVATLPRLWIPVSGFLVTPVLAWWHAPHPVAPVDPGEVAEVHRVPIQELVDPRNRVRVRHPSGYVGPAFEVRGMLVWGFTAGVLGTVLELGGWARPWDHDRVVGLP
jgi:8-oxo-dGTP pyrophosphatase MutT (NUDIX family)